MDPRSVPHELVEREARREHRSAVRLTIMVLVLAALALIPTLQYIGEDDVPAWWSWSGRLIGGFAFVSPFVAGTVWWDSRRWVRAVTGPVVPIRMRAEGRESRGWTLHYLIPSRTTDYFLVLQGEGTPTYHVEVMRPAAEACRKARDVMVVGDLHDSGRIAIVWDGNVECPVGRAHVTGLHARLRPLSTST